MTTVSRRDALELVHETLLGEAVATSDAGVVVSDEALNYLACNTAACTLLGYTREELVTLRVTDVVDASAAALEHEALRVVDGLLRHGTIGVKRKDGTTLDVSYVSARGTLRRADHVVTVFWATTQ